MRRALFILGMLGCSALSLLAPGARADYAVLRNGQRLHVTGYQRQGDSVELQVDGGKVVLPVTEIVSFEREEVFQPIAASTNKTKGPYGGIIRAAAEKHGVSERLIRGVVAAESNFEPRAISPKNAQGLMQLMPSTARQLEVSNAFDPAQNVDGGTRYLKQLLGQYHQDVNLALAAYNAGPERVKQYGGVPPFAETQAYLRRVARHMKKDGKKAKESPAGTRSMVCSPFEAACKETVDGR